MAPDIVLLAHAKNRIGIPAYSCLKMRLVEKLCVLTRGSCPSPVCLDMADCRHAGPKCSQRPRVQEILQNSQHSHPWLHPGLSRSMVPILLMPLGRDLEISTSTGCARCRVIRLQGDGPSSGVWII